jgi:protein-disulfide isomerase
MSTRLDKALSVTMTLCAVALVAIVIAREFGVTPSQTTAAVPEPTLVENWREVLAQGMQVGDEDADVQLVEFVDFQCPFCARFHNEVLPRVLDDADVPIGVVLIHFPLSIHELAVPLAQGAECAREQDRLSEYAEAVFAETPTDLDDDLWSRLGSKAGIPDRELFMECAETEDPGLRARIDESKSFGIELGVRATPTIMIDGWRFPIPPDANEILRVVAAVRAGEQPF